jgi:hypothetical protein
MSTYQNSLTTERLREVLAYNPETGILTWIKKTSPSVRIQIGNVAGSPNVRGYPQISIDGVLYGAHRLAFLFMLGRWPVDQVDHINLIRDDNRWRNLREATRAENRRNIRTLRNNTSGFKGVSKQTHGGWQARITIDGHLKHLGTFVSPEEAHTAYYRAATKHFGKFARMS